MLEPAYFRMQPGCTAVAAELGRLRGPHGGKGRAFLAVALLLSALLAASQTPAAGGSPEKHGVLTPVQVSKLSKCALDCRWESKRVIGHFPLFGRGLVALLVLLVIIHVYWFSIIVQIAYKKVMTGVGEDVRETSKKSQ